MVDVFDDAGRTRERGLSRLHDAWPAIFSPWGPLAEWFSHQHWDGGPSVEISEEDRELVVRVEFAGVKPEDLNVWVNDDSVTVAGERRAQQRERAAEGGYFRSERRYGMFRRTIALPISIDSNQALAKLEHGVLEIRAPKRDSQHSRYGRKLPIQ